MAEATVRFRDTCIELAHGAGGKASRRLIEGLFCPFCETQPSRALPTRLFWSWKG